MPDNGYQKKDRLLKRSTYLSLSKTGKKCHKGLFLCIYRNGNMERSRLGITVTKKVGCAAKRNRIKRRCREFYRLNKRELVGIWDINIVAKKGAADASWDQTMASFKEIFRAISDSENRLSDISS